MHPNDLIASLGPFDTAHWTKLRLANAGACVEPARLRIATAVDDAALRIMFISTVLLLHPHVTRPHSPEMSWQEQGVMDTCVVHPCERS